MTALSQNPAVSFVRSVTLCGQTSPYETKQNMIDLVFVLDFLGAQTEVKHGLAGGSSSWDDLAQDFSIASCFDSEDEARSAISEAGQTVQSMADHAASALDELADVEL